MNSALWHPCRAAGLRAGPGVGGPGRQVVQWLVRRLRPARRAPEPSTRWLGWDAWVDLPPADRSEPRARGS